MAFHRSHTASARFTPEWSLGRTAHAVPVFYAVMLRRGRLRRASIELRSEESSPCPTRSTPSRELERGQRALEPAQRPRTSSAPSYSETSRRAEIPAEIVDFHIANSGDMEPHVCVTQSEAAADCARRRAAPAESARAAGAGGGRRRRRRGRRRRRATSSSPRAPRRRAARAPRASSGETGGGGTGGSATGARVRGARRRYGGGRRQRVDVPTQGSEGRVVSAEPAS